MTGITVRLWLKIQTGTDDFNRPVYTQDYVDVNNVLVAPEDTSSADVIQSIAPTARKSVYKLAIPKGDAHNWEDCDVEFFGHKWHTFGDVEEGIESLIPLAWNKKIRAERVN